MPDEPTVVHADHVVVLAQALHLLRHVSQQGGFDLNKARSLASAGFEKLKEIEAVLPFAAKAAEQQRIYDSLNANLKKLGQGELASVVTLSWEMEKLRIENEKLKEKLGKMLNIGTAVALDEYEQGAEDMRKQCLGAADEVRAFGIARSMNMTMMARGADEVKKRIEALTVFKPEGVKEEPSGEKKED